MAKGIGGAIGGGRGGGGSFGGFGTRIGGSIAKSGSMTGGGGPERGGGFASVGFARGFSKVGGDRSATVNALRINALQRFSEGGPARAVNTNFRSLESPRPLRSNLSSRRTELFRVPKSGILRTEGFREVPRTENQFIKPRPQRSILTDTKSAIRWALDQSQRSQRLKERTNTEKSAGVNLNHPRGVTDVTEPEKGRTLEQAQNKQHQAQGRTLDEQAKKGDLVREQVLEASVYQRLSRIVGPEKARSIVLNTRKSAGVNLNHPGGVPERKKRLGLARVLTGTEIGAEAVAVQAAQTEAVGRAASSAATESATRNKIAARTREKTQIVSERQQKIAEQKIREQTVKRDKKIKSQTRTKIFQEYLAAKFARINQARKIFDRIEDENRQKGENSVSGTDVAQEFIYTKNQESLAISQLGRAQKDGSHLATRGEIANQKYITLEKLEGIVNAHAPTEIVERVTTRQSTDRELAEVFDDPDKVPAALTASSGEKVVYINASSARAEKITEEISEKTGEKPSGATQTTPAHEAETKRNPVANLSSKIIEPEPLFKKLENVLGIPGLPKAA